MNRFYVVAVSAILALPAYFQVEAKGMSANEPGDDSGVITNPVGNRVVYSRSSVSVMPMGDVPMETEDYGFAGILVFGNDGKVFLRNPFSQFVTGTYLEGTLQVSADDGIPDFLTFELPQLVTIYEEDGVSYDLYACMLQFSDDGETIETADCQTLEFKNNFEGGWEMTDADAILGLTFDDSSWTGFAETDMAYAPIAEVPVDVPADVEFKKWMLTYGNEGHYVDVAIDGSKCYIKNFLPTSGDSLAPMVGTINDDSITFKSPQYLGVNEDCSYLTYFYGGEIKKTYIEEIDMTVTTFIPGEEMNFIKDSAGVYHSDCDAMFTPFADISNEYFWEMGVFDNPMLQESVVEDFTPANPAVVAYQYYPNFEFGYVSFDIPMLNSEGEVLDSNNLFYNVYLDGELLEFNSDEYPLFTESMTDIPYDFEDGTDGSGDVKIDGSMHTIILYREGIEEIGVRSFYSDGDGKKYYSELITISTAGATSIASDSIEEIYYMDLMGNRVENPKKGILIKVIRLSDGSMMTQKIRF